MTKQSWRTLGKIGLLGLVFLVLTCLISEIAQLCYKIHRNIRWTLLGQLARDDG